MPCAAPCPSRVRPTPRTRPQPHGLAPGAPGPRLRQFARCVGVLAPNGARTIDLPPELHPGIDYAAHVLDPDGHVLQLYPEMEQIGWDGRPRPRSQRRKAPRLDAWPQTLEGTSDAYRGEPFLGPWR